MALEGRVAVCSSCGAAKIYTGDESLDSPPFFLPKIRVELQGKRAWVTEEYESYWNKERILK